MRGQTNGLPDHPPLTPPIIKGGEKGGGYHQGRKVGGHSGPLGRTFLFATFLMGAIYILNQLRDMESDRLNRKLFLLPEGWVQPGNAWTEAVILFLLACFGGFRISPLLGLAFLVALILGAAYSLPPPSLKDRPWGALLANMLGHGLLAFSFGWLGKLLQPTTRLRGY